MRFTPPLLARQWIASLVMPWMLSRSTFRWRLAPPLPRPLPPLPHPDISAARTPVLGESPKSVGLDGGCTWASFPPWMRRMGTGGVTASDAMVGVVPLVVWLMLGSARLRDLWLLPSFPVSWVSSSKLFVAQVCMSRRGDLCGMPGWFPGMYLSLF
jgi:hypothetical protein